MNSKTKSNRASTFKKSYQIATNPEGQIVLLHRSVHKDDGYKAAYWKIVPWEEEIRTIIARYHGGLNGHPGRDTTYKKVLKKFVLLDRWSRNNISLMQP